MIEINMQIQIDSVAFIITHTFYFNIEKLVSYTEPELIIAISDSSGNQIISR